MKHISEATITSLGYTPLSKRRGDRAGAWRAMIFPSNRVRIVIATKPVDFRKGHDGLAVLVKNELRKKPFTGTVFVFRVKRTDRLKLLYWDGTGLVMTHKRLEETTFTWPAIRDGLMSLNHAQFEALFAGLDWRKVKALAGAAADCERVNQGLVCASVWRPDLVDLRHDSDGRSS